jgi:porin
MTATRTGDRSRCAWLAAIGVAGALGAIPPAAGAEAAPGLTLAGAYIGEFERNYDPGQVSPRLKTAYHDKLELSLSADTGQAGLWPGGTLFIQGMRIHGDQPSRFVIGDLQIASNIEAPAQLVLEQAWYEQRLLHGRLALLAGLYDLNRDFNVSEYAALFLNSSFGIGPEISANVPASIYPRPGWGARIRIQPTARWYVQLADLDGDPETRALSAREGQMWVAETGIEGPHGQYKLGAWLHTATKAYGGRVFRNDYGAYVLADQQLAAIGAARIGAFVRYGWVPPARNAVTRFLGLGLHVAGAIPSRDQDMLGLGLARAVTHTGAEDALELTYRAVVSSSIAIQPSFQWINDPGGTAGAPPVRVGLLRFELAF